MGKTTLFVLGEDPTVFPDPAKAVSHPNGLLAIGGDLSPQRLLNAYRHGLFPWYEDEPILWWCPDPRAVLFLADLKISNSLKKTIRQHRYEVKIDHNFSEIIKACASPRPQKNPSKVGTWITDAMQSAYIKLHELGYAHSIEVYSDDNLIGGIYGVSLGRTFFGESMFSRKTNGSKIALFYLVRQLENWGFEFIDCQVESLHLTSLGARLISRARFLQKLDINNKFETKIGKWTLTPGLCI